MTAGATTAARPSTPGVPISLGPVAWVGSTVIVSLAYLGGLAILVLAAAFSVVSVSREDDVPGFWSTLKNELGWLLFMGLPLIGLVHVGMGSFLSMQAYFGSTFVDGTGAVVGVGLLRNVASLVTGMTLSGLIACRIIPERLGTRRRPFQDPGFSAPSGLVSRTHAGEVEGVGSHTLRAGRLTAPRLVACGLATILLSLWGFVVGTAIGWQAAGTLMGLSSSIFFHMFYQMIWYRDVVGLVVKGLCFGLLTAAVCCFESLRAGELPGADPGGSDADDPNAGTADLASPIVRAACLSMVAILILNMAWFILVYHAVPVYGPSLLQPPSP
jgi:phospholipid/cholesterol/gamma-HCH transport system permease protein